MIEDIIRENEKIKINDKEITVLKEYFPGCFKLDGSFDVEKFTNIIKEKVDISKEGYELNFLGKSYAKLLASIDTTTIIKPDLEHNEININKQSENIYISGDNLDALKHLLKSYAKGIKCIYIDPPYNTGSDGFVYNDRFNFTKEEIINHLSIDEAQAEKIVDMTNKGHASHSAWLTFMYPRLLLARDLLTDDGVIFISIDDNEQANLKLICDDIYGEENFVANVAWKHTQQSKNDEVYFSRQYNALLIYRKSDKTKGFKFNRTEKDNKNYSNPDNDINGAWRSGDVRSPNYRKTLCYDIITPSGKTISPPQNGWRWSEDTLKEKIINGEIIFNKDETNIVRKIYLKNQEGRTPENFWDGDEYGTTRMANAELKELFNGESPFETPKPTQLIMKVMELLGDNSDYTVLDFFSGSGTTAHAVIKMNKQDGGKRKFILVQVSEEIAENKVAYKQGYRRIDEVGINRIKLSANTFKEYAEDIDLGFKHFELVDVNNNTLDKLERFDKNAALDDKDIVDSFGVAAILTTWLIRDGYGFGAIVKEIDLGGYIAYLSGKHLYMINTGISNDNINNLLERYEGDGGFNPENIILFGYSFLGWTQIEMIKNNVRLLNDSEKNLKVNVVTRY
ncbi:site-specific DNA-methyltransferase [Clostridium sp. UBA3061]|uniref:site-specific DNA-methyltransferase n=1 Tax=Clostridium sp. UBA3061 TaxID=1946353 RepID=UPI003217111A